MIASVLVHFEFSFEFFETDRAAFCTSSPVLCIGTMRAQIDDSSRTESRLNGVVIESFSSSESAYDNATFLELGLRYPMPWLDQALHWDFGVTRTNELFVGEDLTAYTLRLSLDF